MKVLFLDDNIFRCIAATRTFVDSELYVTHTAEGAIQAVSSGSFGFVTLDHDLNGESFVDSGRADCGMEVVRWIVENHPVIETVNVHSWNHAAADKMVDLLNGAGYHTSRRLFGDNGFADEAAT